MSFGNFFGGEQLKVVIAGGTGFIGAEIAQLLVEHGHDIVILTRKPSTQKNGISYVQWLTSDSTPAKDIRFADAIINLAGISLNEGRWTSDRQKQIYESRITATEELLSITNALEKPPSVWINASAIGIYPSSENEIYTEDSPLYATDFLGKTVSDWETKAAEASDLGIRVAYMRFGIVLGKRAGALPLMMLPYKLFVGGTVGSGKQWMSWVHVHDVARAILFTIETESVSGAVNVVSPNPVQMKQFGKTISTVLHRPHWFPVPAPFMKLALGKKSALVLEGQHVIPKKLLTANFQFTFPTLEKALQNLV